MRLTPWLWMAPPTLALIGVFAWLGNWQLARARYKEELRHHYLQRQQAPPLTLDATQLERTDLRALDWRPLQMTGSYHPDTDLLLDNQVWQRQAGSRVYTPFRLRDSSTWVLVERGWLAAGLRRDTPPQLQRPAAGELRTRGQAAPLPVMGIRLAEEGLTEKLADGLYRLQALEPQALRQLLGIDLRPLVVRLAADEPHGFLRAWPAVGVGRQRHLGYAYQWFSFAALTLVFYLVLCRYHERKKQRRPNAD